MTVTSTSCVSGPIGVRGPAAASSLAASSTSTPSSTIRSHRLPFFAAWFSGSHQVTLRCRAWLWSLWSWSSLLTGTLRAARGPHAAVKLIKSGVIQVSSFNLKNLQHVYPTENHFHKKKPWMYDTSPQEMPNSSVRFFAIVPAQTSSSKPASKRKHFNPVCDQAAQIQKLMAQVEDLFQWRMVVSQHGPSLPSSRWLRCRSIAAGRNGAGRERVDCASM
jgi:hypothetical protein